MFDKVSLSLPGSEGGGEYLGSQKVKMGFIENNCSYMIVSLGQVVGCVIVVSMVTKPNR